MTSRAQLCLAITVLCLSVPSLSRADTITITGGSLISTGLFEVSPPSTITGTGGFRASGQVVAVQARVDPLTFCDGTDACAPHQTISIGFALDAVDGLNNTSVSYGGVTYTDFSLFDGGALSLEGTGSIIAPAFGNRQPIVVTAPFTLTGIFSPPPSNPALAALTLTGHGTATIWLTPGPLFEDAPSGWIGQQVRYAFDSPSQTPEPSSLLLAAGGLATLFGARRRRR